MRGPGSEGRGMACRLNALLVLDLVTLLVLSVSVELMPSQGWWYNLSEF